MPPRILLGGAIDLSQFDSNFAARANASPAVLGVVVAAKAKALAAA
jgi:hypothetical protein